MFAFKALESGNLTYNQLEIVRRVVGYKTFKTNFFKLRVFPYLLLTQKKSGSKMGSGVGIPTHLIFKVRKGSLIFEIGSLSKFYSRALHKSIKSKFSFRIAAINRFS